MRTLALLLICAPLAPADSWNCHSVTSTVMAVTPANPCAGANGGAFTQTATYSVVGYNLQTHAPEGNPLTATLTANGACTPTSNTNGQGIPAFSSTKGYGATATGAQQVWWAGSATQFVPDSSGAGAVPGPKASTPAIPVQPAPPCQCFSSDCCNPAAAGQCPVTCPSASCKCTGGTGGSQVAIAEDRCTPILYDLTGRGFDVSARVRFDVFGTGNKVEVDWPAAGSGNAWLALPGPDGKVTTFSQLFGNLTPQPPIAHPNGFAALAVYDTAGEGGNGDGRISPADRIWPRLRLWVDRNGDGISQPDELLTLDQAGVEWIDLGARVDAHSDDWGNWFVLRGMSCDRLGARNAIWDVWLR